MHARDGLHQVGRGMVAKVGADVADAQATPAGLQVLGVLKGRLMKSIDLLGGKAGVGIYSSSRYSCS